MTAATEDTRKTCALVVEDDPNIVDLIRSRKRCWESRSQVTSGCIRLEA